MIQQFVEEGFKEFSFKQHTIGKLGEYDQRSKDGVAKFLVKAIESVKSKPELVMPGKLRKQFLGMSVKRTAATLCNTIATFRHLPPKKTFDQFFIDAVNSNVYKYHPGTKTFSYVLSYDRLVAAMGFKGAKEIYMPGKHRDKSNKYNYDRAIAALDKAGQVSAIVRNRRNTHTYLIVKEKGVWRCEETWHAKWQDKLFSARDSKENGFFSCYYYEVRR